ncbi:enhanced intracellular survival protein Eis [Paenibacillus sp. 1P07SE]|uniref:GNAT family N-acetyltransferase n=1 Tax=Paenibacillus sp. 1P07SE TaxID=3132209 RepID=UPI0039A41EDF
MELRTLTADEVDASLELAMYAFQFKLSEQELAQVRSQAKPHETWGVFEGKELVAQLTLLPLTAYLAGKPMAMGGIAGVSTWPEHRRKGAVGKLMIQALEQMRQNGQTISFLTPFDFQFYRRYGWEMYVEYKAYTLNTALLPSRRQVEGTITRYSELNKELVNVIAPLYEVYASGYNGTLARKEDWWFTSIFRRNQGQVAVFNNADGAPRGYVFYKVADREFVVHELVYLDTEARQGLWNFIANHDSMIERVQLKAPSDDPLPYLLPNPRFEQKLVPYFMGRIVDVEAFFKSYPFNSILSDEPLTIAVSDEHAPWNEGMYELAFNENGLHVTKYNQPPAGQAQLSCSIQALSAMMIGYKRPQTLWELQLIEGDREAASRLEALIPVHTTYLMDFF